MDATRAAAAEITAHCFAIHVPRIMTGALSSGIVRTFSDPRSIRKYVLDSLQRALGTPDAHDLLVSATSPCNGVVAFWGTRDAFAPAVRHCRIARTGGASQARERGRPSHLGRRPPAVRATCRGRSRDPAPRPAGARHHRTRRPRRFAVRGYQRVSPARAPGRALARA